MSIDLSELKALELPTKEVELEIAGKKQTVTITALGGDGATAIDGISGKVDSTTKLYIIFLMYGANMTENNAIYFLRNDRVNADFLVAEISKLSKEYADKRNAEQEEAKKK